MTPSPRPPGARTIDELLASVRARIDRVHPREVPARVAAGALLVDTRPWEQRRRDGAVPGAVVVALFQRLLHVPAEHAASPALAR